MMLPEKEMLDALYGNIADRRDANVREYAFTRSLSFSLIGYRRWWIEVSRMTHGYYAQLVANCGASSITINRIYTAYYAQLPALIDKAIKSPWDEMTKSLVSEEIQRFIRANTILAEEVGTILETCLIRMDEGYWSEKTIKSIENELALQHPALVENYRIARKMR